MKLFLFKFDNIIDLITNSSSELFLIQNTMSVEVLVDLVNSALGGNFINNYCVEERIIKEESSSDEWVISDILNKFPEEVRGELKEKYFSKPNWYGISFDRDRDDIREIEETLQSIGFELYDTDY